MKTKLLVVEEYSTMPGYCRLVVQWREKRTLRTVSSGVITPTMPPEAIAEELRGLGYRILKARADDRGSV